MLDPIGFNDGEEVSVEGDREVGTAGGVDETEAVPLVGGNIDDGKGTCWPVDETTEVVDEDGIWFSGAEGKV